MKRVIILAAASILFLASCGMGKGKVIGKWQSEPTMLGTMVFEFDKDDNFSISVSGNKYVEGTYSIDKDIITMTEPHMGTNRVTVYKFRVKNDKLSLIDGNDIAFLTKVKE